VVRHGENGLLVPPGDAESLTAALRVLLTDAAGRERMSRAARRYVETEADSEACLDRLERFYAGVAGGKP
jgi:glycosyltransferase involved in cell wall biosynthesis